MHTNTTNDCIQDLFAGLYTSVQYSACTRMYTDAMCTVVCSCTRTRGVHSCTESVWTDTKCMYIVESALFVDVHELEVYSHRC